MKTYIIYKVDSNRNHIVVGRIEAANGKSALKKFRNGLLSRGMYEIHRIKPCEWELSSSYGGYWYAEKEELK